MKNINNFKKDIGKLNKKLTFFYFLKKSFRFEEKRMSDLYLLQIIGLLVLGHIILGFAWIIFKIYRKKDKNNTE